MQHWNNNFNSVQQNGNYSGDWEISQNYNQNQNIPMSRVSMPEGQFNQYGRSEWQFNQYGGGPTTNFNQGYVNNSFWNQTPWYNVVDGTNYYNSDQGRNLFANLSQMQSSYYGNWQSSHYGNWQSSHYVNGQSQNTFHGGANQNEVLWQTPFNRTEVENLRNFYQTEGQFNQIANNENICYRLASATDGNGNLGWVQHLPVESSSSVITTEQSFYASVTTSESNMITGKKSCDPVAVASSGTEKNIEKEHSPLVNYLTYLYELPEDGVGLSTVNDEIVPQEHHCSTDSEAITTVITQPKLKLGCDDTFMSVKTSDQRGKKLCCPYCNKLVAKFARHLEDIHNDEDDVQKFMSFPKNSKPRHAIQTSLKKIGLLNFNKNAALNNNQLIPIRRPNVKHNKTSATKFTTCPYCYGPYAISGLYYHKKYKCPNRPVTDERTAGERVTKYISTSIEARYHQDASPALQKVFNKFKNDEIVRAIRFDWLVILYGNKLATKYTKRTSPDMIKNRLRLVGRFMLAIKEIEPQIIDMASIYIPKHYNLVVDAIRAIARVDPVRNEFIAPATATSAATAIRQIGRHLVSEYIMRDDQEKQRVTNNFLTVMNDDIHISINKMAIETQSRKARQKVLILPSSEDVKLLSQYTEAQRRIFYTRLSKSFEFKDWLQLAESTMASIIVFNRRRVGDTENILDEDFAYKENFDENTDNDLVSALSKQSREIASQYSRMKVRGKKNRSVPVLLKPDVNNCVKLLIAHREEAGVPLDNHFLFGLPSEIHNDRVIDAGRVLSKFAKACGAKNPKVLTATNLRKHLATVCVKLKLSDSSVADVADFMGHREKVHRDYYRQNTIERQIVQMSQVLEAAQGGSMVDSVADDSNSVVHGKNSALERHLAQENLVADGNVDGTNSKVIRNSGRKRKMSSQGSNMKRNPPPTKKQKKRK